MFFPVFLNLQNKRVVIIGGGEVAERKLESLIGAGATITVISPEVTPRLALLAAQHEIEIHRRAYQPGDCEGAAFVFSATDDPEVSRAVFEEAARIGALTNTADQPALCDFIMPAMVRRGDVVIAISTGGTSPGLAARLRQEIEKVVGPEYAQLAELMAGAREEIRQRISDPEIRKAVHYRILDSDIIELLKRNDVAAAERRLKEIIGS